MKIDTMTPQQIKLAIEVAGFTQAALARELDVSPQHFGQVVHGIAANHRVRCYIAKAIQRPVENIWEIKENPTKVGRPISYGLYEHQAA
ncbi:MAG: helix-turn-helix domain-containing protein [Proteobacteria bacterium]|nr:helix-turn-helix domain-containing protein [Pseudomonadota bacterium]